MKQIWAKNLRDEMNIALCFKKSFKCQENTTLLLSSNVPFRLSVNDRMISYGPRRAAHKHAAINTYNLSEYSGKDIDLRIDCVSYRVSNFYAVNQEPFFGAEIVCNGKVIADSFDFSAYRNYSKLQKVQRFSFQRGFTECWRIDKGWDLRPIEVDEKEVCILQESFAPYPKFSIENAKEFESGDIFVLDNFKEFDDSYLNRNGAQCFGREEQEYRISSDNDKYGFIKTDKVKDVLDKNYKCYKLERNATGFIAFDVDVLQDAEIMINYDEIISPYEYSYTEKFRSDKTTEKNSEVITKTEMYINGASNIDVNRLHTLSLVHYSLTKGKYKLQNFEPDTMQFIKFYVTKGKIKLSNVRLITYENQDIKLKFNCADEDINLLFESAINTFKGNAVDILTDCASRERAGWLCDSFFSGRAEKLLTGENKVERNLIQTFIDYKPEYCKDIPTQAFPMCYPADMDKSKKYIPNWCMWFIIEVKSYIDRNNDYSVAELLKDKFITFADYMLSFSNEDGLLEDIPGWIFVEWSRANDLTEGVNYPTNMLFSCVLKTLYSLYGIEKYKTVYEKMDLEIEKQSFNGSYFVDNAVRDKNNKLQLNSEWTETCQYYAFWCGFASKEKYPALFETVFDGLKDFTNCGDKYPNMSRSNMFIGLYLRIDYLSRIRENQKVLRDIKSFFLYQAKLTKSIWEYKAPEGSLNHAFASLMCEWIVKATTGFDKIENDKVVILFDGLMKDAKAQIPFNAKMYEIK